MGNGARQYGPTHMLGAPTNLIVMLARYQPRLSLGHQLFAWHRGSVLANKN